jgi:hypothetical protein
MAGLVPAINVLALLRRNVDARDKPGMTSPDGSGSPVPGVNGEAR